jgi:hypothetical protein
LGLLGHRPIQVEKYVVDIRLHVNAYSLAGEVPLDIYAHNLVACHIGLDLVVLLQDHKEMVEVLHSHIFHSKIVDD